MNGLSVGPWYIRTNYIHAHCGNECTYPNCLQLLMMFLSMFTFMKIYLVGISPKATIRWLTKLSMPKDSF